MPTLSEWRSKLKSPTAKHPPLVTEVDIAKADELAEPKPKEKINWAKGKPKPILPKDAREKVVGRFGLKVRHKPPPPPKVTPEDTASVPEGYIPTQSEATEYCKKRVKEYGDMNSFMNNMVKRVDTYKKQFTEAQLAAIGKMMAREPINEVRSRLLLVSRLNGIMKYVNDEVAPTINEDDMSSTAKKKRRHMADLLGVAKSIIDRDGRMTEKQFHFALYRVYKLAPHFLSGIDTSQTRGIPTGFHMSGPTTT